MRIYAVGFGCFIMACCVHGASQCCDHADTRIYIANDDHTDYMWSTHEAEYDAAFVELIDFHLDLIEQTRDNPSSYQNRFNLDGWFWLHSYKKQKSPEAYERLIQQIREGRISVPLNALASCYGAQPTEAVLRGMYPAGGIERRNNLRIHMAVAMENQGLPLGLASLWAGSGAKYSWRGVCGCVPKKYVQDELRHREHEIYWYRGMDGQQVLMKWHSLYHDMKNNFGGNRFIGGYAEAFNPEYAIDFLSENETFLSRYHLPGSETPYAVRGAFGYGWDAIARKTGEPYLPRPEQYPVTDHFHTIAAAKSNEERQVIVSNEVDFFTDFEASYGRDLPHLQVTHGNEWDLYSASMAETSAKVRRNVEKLRSAEAVATWVSLYDKDLIVGSDLEKEREEAYVALGLYWEHNWTADGPLPREVRAFWQNQLADDVETYVSNLLEDGLTRFSELMPRGGPFSQFFVFNPLGWERSDYADFPFPVGEEIHVCDLETDETVPHQFTEKAGKSYLRIWASGIPALGYKRFEIREGAGTGFEPAASAETTQRPVLLQNHKVLLAVERDGAITSLKLRHDPEREMVKEVDGLFLNDLADNEIYGNWTTIENSGPVSLTLLCISKASRNHTTRITVYRDSERIDIENEITENFGDVRHWAFSLNLSDPRIRTEEIGAIIDVATASEGGHYADRSARYDYASMNHFCDISEGDNSSGVTISNWDCSFFKPGRSTPRWLDTGTPQIRVLAGGQVDGDRLGIRNQYGAEHFLQRFSIRPHRGYDPVKSMRFAMEHQNPLLTGSVSGGSDAVLQQPAASLFSNDESGVLLWSIKPAEEGIAKGVVTRLWNVSNSPSKAFIGLQPGIQRALHTTHLETDLGEVAPVGARVAVDFEAQQLRTLRLLPARR